VPSCAAAWVVSSVAATANPTIENDFI
jgi:hypothetical protein